MIGALGVLWRFRRIAGIAVVAIGLLVGWWWISGVIEDRDRAERQLASVRQANVAMQDALKIQSDDHARQVAALEGAAKAAAERVQSFNKIREEAANHATEDNACVGPAVRSVLDGLQQRRSGG